MRFNQLTEAQRRGIIAWKQGWCYKIMAPSAKGVVMINSRKPLVGVKYHEGPGSPQRSAIAHGGGIPAKIKYDMGVVDVNISVPQEFYRFERKPKLAFEPDLEQQTWETRPGWGRPVASRPQGILRTRPDRQRRTARTSKPRKAKKSKTTRQALMLKHKKTTPGISQVGGL